MAWSILLFSDDCIMGNCVASAGLSTTVFWPCAHVRGVICGDDDRLVCDGEYCPYGGLVASILDSQGYYRMLTDLFCRQLGKLLFSIPGFILSLATGGNTDGSCT
jgi:hypothetical protein